MISEVRVVRFRPTITFRARAVQSQATGRAEEEGQAKMLLSERSVDALDLVRYSDLLIDQLRAIDNARLVRGPLTTLEDTAVAHVDEALSNVLDLARTQAAGGDVEEALAPDEPEREPT